MSLPTLLPIVLSLCGALWAADQSKLGEGNGTALRTGHASQLVRNAMKTLVENAQHIRNPEMRRATLDALVNRRTCVAHRVAVAEEVKTEILAKLIEHGLVPGGEVTPRVFPPLMEESSACPHLPLTFDAEPGSSFGGHHPYPGGLAVHEAFNLQLAKEFAALYRSQYQAYSLIDQDVVIVHPRGTIGRRPWCFSGRRRVRNLANGVSAAQAAMTTTVHRRLADGSASHPWIGGNMARGLPPELVITQASAHAAPSLGNEYKVVNWLLAAAILPRIDPAAKGYLVIDRDGHWRLPR